MGEQHQVKVTSLIARTLHDSGELLEWAEVVVPYGGLLGKALRTIPWADIVDWAELIYKRYHSAERPISPVSAAVNTLTPVVTGVQATPAHVAPDVARAIADLVVSEPFSLAVGEAVAGFPKLLCDFISRTRPLGAGIWPTFAFEQLARLYFRRKLSAAAAATVPEVAQLVEMGLARELLDELQAAVLKTQHQSPPGLKIDMSIGAAYLWAVEQSYVWPRAGDLRPGYFSGYSSSINFPPPEFKKAQDEAKRLLARLGRMSRREIENLSELWLLQCDAMIASRKWEPLDSNLAQMRMPLFSALLALEQRGTTSDDVRPKLEKMLKAIKTLGIAPADTVNALGEAESMLESVAEDDSFKFGRSAASLRKEVASNYRFGLRGKANAPTIEEGISALSELTGWKPSSMI